MRIPYWLLALPRIPQKDIHKMLILSSFRDFKNVHRTFTQKHPQYAYYVDNNVKMSNEMNADLRKASDEQDLCIEQFVSNVRNYCKYYPDEKICRWPDIKDYEEYPYRMRQNIVEAMRQLD